MNRPLFRSEAKNNCIETVSNTIPTMIGNDQVLVNQTGQRNIEDAIFTYLYPMSVQMGNPQYAPQICNHVPAFQSRPAETWPTSPYNPIKTQMPDGRGVTFSFQDNGNYNTSCQPPCQHSTGSPMSTCPCNADGNMQSSDPSRLQYEIALKQLEQQVLQNMLNQSHMKMKPNQLMFHFNAATSTTGLVTKWIGSTQTTPKQMQDKSSEACECGCSKYYDADTDDLLYSSGDDSCSTCGSSCGYSSQNRKRVNKKTTKSYHRENKLENNPLLDALEFDILSSKKSTHVNLSPQVSEMPLPPKPPPAASPKKISFSDNVFEVEFDALTSMPPPPPLAPARSNEDPPSSIFSSNFRNAKRFDNRMEL